MYVCMVITYQVQQSMDQPGKVDNPARGQLNRENYLFLSPFAPENLVSRDGFGSPVPRQPSHLHTPRVWQSRPASVCCLRLNLVLTYGIPPDFRGGVHLI